MKYLLIYLIYLYIYINQIISQPPSPSTSIYYVDIDATGSNTGTSWANAYTDPTDINLQASEVWFAAGTYYPSSGTDRTATFSMGQGQLWYGGFAGTETSRNERDPAANPTILSGDIGVANDDSDNSYHVVTGPSESTGTLDGFIIEYGNADDGSGDTTNAFGGCLYLENAQMTLNDLEFRYCKALGGAAIYGYYESDSTLTDIYFHDNSAESNGNDRGGTGGAILLRNGADFTVSSCTFTDNYAEFYGGAVYNDYGGLSSFTSNTFTTNSAGVWGGAGFFNDRASQATGNTVITFSSNTFTGNTAGEKGGALVFYNSADPSWGSANTFNQNQARVGGAIALWYGATIQDYNTLQQASNTFGTGGNANIADDPEYDDIYFSEEYRFQHYRRGTGELDDVLCYLYSQKFTDTDPTNSNGVIYVDISNTNTQDGTTWNKAYSNLQDAIDDAGTSGKEIWVKEGTYIPGTDTQDSTTDVRSASWNMKDNVYMYGGFAGTETSRSQRNWYTHKTILSGDLDEDGERDENCYHILVGAEGSKVDGFILTLGQADGTGTVSSDGTSTNTDDLTSGISDAAGAAYTNFQISATVENCIIYDNEGNKGVTYNIGQDSSGPPSPPGQTDDSTSGAWVQTFTNVAWVKNFGGGRSSAMGNDVGTDVVCTQCIFYGNACNGKGGAIYNDFFADIELIDSVFYNNFAYEGGGAIGSDGSSVQIITNTYFINNTAEAGGAVYQGTYAASSDPTQSTYTNCYFSDNKGNFPIFWNFHEDFQIETGSTYQDGLDGKLFTTCTGQTTSSPTITSFTPQPTTLSPTPYPTTLSPTRTPASSPTFSPTLPSIILLGSISVSSVQSFNPVPSGGENFGISLTTLHDLDDDDIPDIVVGARRADDGNPISGAIIIIFLTTDGTVKTYTRISNTSGSLTETLATGAFFGTSVATLPDTNFDNIQDLIVGAPEQPDGADGAGAIFILTLKTNGNVKNDYKISATSGSWDGGAITNSDKFGTSVSGAGGDLDDDNVNDILVGCIKMKDLSIKGGSIFIIYLDYNYNVKSYTKLAGKTVFEIATWDIANGDNLGSSISMMGGVGNNHDLNGDGQYDIIVGAEGDDDGYNSAGAFYILFFNDMSLGTVKTFTKISATSGSFTAIFSATMGFGGTISTTHLNPDIDGDNVPDIFTGVPEDENYGAIYILYLKNTGTVKTWNRITHNQPGFTTYLTTGTFFGSGIATLGGDINNDDTLDIVVGAMKDSTSATSSGLVYFLSLSAEVVTDTTPPTPSPIITPTKMPTEQPTNQPTEQPTNQPTEQPTDQPTNQPTNQPTDQQTNQPTDQPTTSPPTTSPPTRSPASPPTPYPTLYPTEQPTTSSPTKYPTPQPTPNTAPTCNNIKRKIAGINEKFTFQFSKNLCTDTKDKNIDYEVYQYDENDNLVSLPSWLTFYPDNYTLQGTPKDYYRYTIAIQGSDNSGLTGETTFYLKVDDIVATEQIYEKSWFAMTAGGIFASAICMFGLSKYMQKRSDGKKYPNIYRKKPRTSMRPTFELNLTKQMSSKFQKAPNSKSQFPSTTNNTFNVVNPFHIQRNHV